MARTIARQISTLESEKYRTLLSGRSNKYINFENRRQRNRHQLAGGGFGSKLIRKLGSVEQCFDILPNRIDGVCGWAQLQPEILGLSKFASRQNCRVDRCSGCAQLLNREIPGSKTIIGCPCVKDVFWWR